MKKYINWGVIGLGNAAKAFSSGFNNLTNSKLLAVASKNEEKRLFFKEKFNLKKEYLYENYEDLINNKDLDIVYVALPHSMHKKWCLKLANAKRNILVEKPAATSLDDISEIINLVKLNNVFLTEGISFRFHSFVNQILSATKKFNINDIYSIESSFGNDAIGGKKIFGLRLKKPDKKKRLFNPNLAGGAIWDGGCYPLSLVRLIISNLNEKKFIKPKIKQIKKFIGTTGVDENSELVLEFGKILSTIKTSINSNLQNNLIIQLKNGKIVVNNPWNPSSNSSIALTFNNQVETIPCLNTENVYKSEIETISNLLLKNVIEAKYPLPDLNDIKENIEFLEKWSKG